MKYFISFASVLFFLFGNGQNRGRLDSMLRIKNAEDTITIKRFNKIAFAYQKINPDSSIFFSDKAINLALILKSNKFYAIARREKLLNSKDLVSPKTYRDSLLILTEDPVIKKEIRILSFVNLELGVVHRKLGNFDKSVECLLQSLKLAQEVKFDKGIYNAYNSLANTYSQLGSSKKSTEDLKRALHYYEMAYTAADTSRKTVLGMIANNIGVNYFNISQLTHDSLTTRRAIECHKKALGLRIATKDSLGIAESYNNLASAYHNLCEAFGADQYIYECKEFYEKAILIDKNTKAPDAYSHLSNYGGHLAYIGKKKNDKKLIREALNLLKESFRASNKVEDIYTSTQLASNIGAVYNFLHQFDSAYHYMIEYTILKDSINSNENRQIADELAERFEGDLKDKENSYLKQQAGLREEVISRKSNTIKLMIGATIIMSLLIIMVLISRQKIRRAKQLIEEQKKRTEEQKHIIEIKNKEIIDSINYARRIQHSLLPSEVFINRILTEKKDKI